MARLIDADKLIELIDDDISGLNSDYISVISQTAYDVALCTFTMVKQYIDALPAIDPVKRGRMRYCPSCGAKMDEVEND